MLLDKEFMGTIGSDTSWGKPSKKKKLTFCERCLRGSGVSFTREKNGLSSHLSSLYFHLEIAALENSWLFGVKVKSKLLKTSKTFVASTCSSPLLFTLKPIKNKFFIIENFVEQCNIIMCWVVKSFLRTNFVVKNCIAFWEWWWLKMLF